MREKREKGLCFRYDGRWSLNHQCRKQELSVLLVQDGDDGPEEDFTEEDAVGVSDEPVGISLNSVVGITNPKTMKLLGKINGHEVVVMIDPRATNNFVSTTVVTKLGLPLTDREKFGVTLGNGEEVEGRGVCKGLHLELQGIIICEDFLSLELGNSNVILGIQWLETLGSIVSNW